MGEQERDLIRPAILFMLGAGFGIVFGAWLVVRGYSPVLFFAGVAASGIIAGLLSARYGGRFWEALRHLRWFVP